MNIINLPDLIEIDCNFIPVSPTDDCTTIGSTSEKANSTFEQTKKYSPSDNALSFSQGSFRESRSIESKSTSTTTPEAQATNNTSEKIIDLSNAKKKVPVQKYLSISTYQNSTFPVIQSSGPDNKDIKNFTSKYALQTQSNYDLELASLELGLIGRHDTALALYQNDYELLDEEDIEYILSFPPHERLLETSAIIEEITGKPARLVYYFDYEQLPDFTLKEGQSFEEYFQNFHSNFISGKIDYADRLQMHCIVVIDKDIYIHPKTETERNFFGQKLVYKTNHASLAYGTDISFAGVISIKQIDENNYRWQIRNFSGHYRTDPSMMKNCFNALKQNGIPLENIDFISCTFDPENPKIVIEEKKLSIQSLEDQLNH